MKEVTRIELEEIVKNAQSKADICRALELAPKGANYSRINRLLQENDIIWNKSFTPWNKGKCYRSIQHKDLKEILIKNSPHKSTYKLKQRLIKEGLKENKCEICGYSESIELHHINGDPTDNRLENLQILCPNCHAKTNNYRSKNIKGRTIQDPKTLYLTEEEIQQRDIERKAKKVGKTVKEYLESKENKKYKTDRICSVCGKSFKGKGTQKYCSQECYKEDTSGNRPPLLQLLKDFSELGSFRQVGNKYDVSDNAVRKWCKLYNIPFHTKELKEYIQNFNNPNFILPECKKMERKVLDYQKIINEYLSGLSTTEVAKLNNCDPTSVRNILRKSNIPLRKLGKSIEQYNMDNELINVFDNVDAVYKWIIKNDIASSKRDTIIGAINRCCRGKSKSAYGFVWKDVESLNFKL